MKLIHIEIQGFKSFADKTKLAFNDGITAVVGPNGSGKSNIADAVRWVLGEQSTKMLRGGKMEDVIFNGTQTRKAQGIAAVTLLIDNADRGLMMDSDEVAVTRRLYRSGDSEYRLNGALVRLKDINELFMDTGVGRDVYSIIGQGRVSDIVSSRGKERREIFEEAAGISRFRYRKGEAEKQLHNAENNLVRLYDILLELESRVGPLKEQSEKAKEFLDLSNEEKKLEVSLWINELKTLKQKSSAVEDSLLLAQGQFDEAEQKTQDYEAEYLREEAIGTALSVGIDTTRNEITDIQQITAQCESQIAVLNNEILFQERWAQEAEENIEKSGLSKEELQQNIITKQALLTDQKKLTEELLSENKGLQEEYEKTLLRQQEELSASDSLKLQRAAVFDELERVRIETASSKTILLESDTRLVGIEQSIAQAEEQITLTKNEIQNCESLVVELDKLLKSAENSLNGYLLKRQGRERKANEIKAQFDDCDAKIKERLARAKLLEDMDKSMEGFGQSVKQVITKAKAGALQGVIGPVSSLVKVDAEYVTAIEVALGAASQNIVTQTQQSAKSAIRMLQDSKSGRATFLPLDTIKGTAIDIKELKDLEGCVSVASRLISFDAKYNSIMNFLLGRIIIAETLDYATSIGKALNYRYRIVTLDGQVVNAGGSLTGGFAAKTAGILGRSAEIERLRKEATTLQAQMDEINVKAQAVLKEIEVIDAEISVIEAEQKTVQEDRVNALTQQKLLSQQELQAIVRKDEVIAEQKLIRERINEIKRESTDNRMLEEKLANRIEEFKALVVIAGEKRAQLTQERDALTYKQSEHSAKCTVAQKDIELLTLELSRAQELLTSNEKVTSEMSEKINTLREQTVTAEQKIAELALMVLNNKEQQQATQEKVNAQFLKREQSEKKKIELRGLEKSSGAQKDLIQRDVWKFTQQMENFDSSRQTIIDKLFDNHALSQSAAEEFAGKIENASASGRRLQELKSKIRQLGTVNVSAIEEYSEVSLRYESLSFQVKDVEKAKTELNRLIAELTGEMCDIFSAKFAEINLNFMKIFVELFGGGHAQLTLADPEDILESGIEISVTPPGKVIKNLAALSGGEQAFVAIAIFFAILKVNPSPFCLLDEIESALDDVNVSRFASYLHKMTGKTQFIAITHRRGTMEEADILYGVTMQEEGVSKLLALKVSEVEKTLGKSAVTP